MKVEKVKIGDVVQIVILDHHSGIVERNEIEDIGEMVYTVYGRVEKIKPKEIVLIKKEVTGGLNCDDVEVFYAVKSAIVKIRRLKFDKDVKV